MLSSALSRSLSLWFAEISRALALTLLTTRYPPPHLVPSHTQSRVRIISQRPSHRLVPVHLHPHQRHLPHQTSPKGRQSTHTRPTRSLLSFPLLPPHPRTFHPLPTRRPQPPSPTTRAIPPRSCLLPARVSCKYLATTSPPIPPCPYEKVLLAPISSPHEVPLFHRRKASLPQEIFRCPPARRPDQIEHRLCIRLTVCMVKPVILVPSVRRWSPSPDRSGHYSIFVSRWHDAIIALTDSLQ